MLLTASAVKEFVCFVFTELINETILSTDADQHTQEGHYVQQSMQQTATRRWMFGRYALFLFR